MRISLLLALLGVVALGVSRLTPLAQSGPWLQYVAGLALSAAGAILAIALPVTLGDIRLRTGGDDGAAFIVAFVNCIACAVTIVALLARGTRFAPLYVFGLCAGLSVPLA